MKVLYFVLGLFSMQSVSTPNSPPDDFNYFSEQFEDLRILRYNVPGFDQLSLKQKKLAYYLSRAALAGRDIYWDQNYRHNLMLRRALEQIVINFNGDRNSEVYKNLVSYAKRVWFSNGVHHHYSQDKFSPKFSLEDFIYLISHSPRKDYPGQQQDLEQVIWTLAPVIFDKDYDNKKVCLDEGIDIVASSAVNFYDGVTQKEVEEYFDSIRVPNDETPISYGLNSKRVKQDGKVSEQVYKVGGLYSEALTEVVKWLRLAAGVAESDLQKAAFLKLIEYYESGDLRKFDEYNILWLSDVDSVVDAVNGFIEVYDDPLGHTGSWESVVSIKDLDATRKFGVLSREAQWFEDNSPILAQHKRPTVNGVSYKIINVVQEAGASSPATPIGINLPNADWIRSKHGSKSVSLGNIEHAYSKASMSAVSEEFFLPEQRAWITQYGDISDRLHTGLHEVVGHASGQLEPGVLPPHQTLKNYASALEEGRADLVGLYYVGNPHLVDIGVSPTPDIIKAAYTQYINNGLLKQLSRIDLGKNIEESHMRNRHMVSQWAYERGKAKKVIERIDQPSPQGFKTYFVINDFDALRTIFGELLREVQRIKSQGDFEAGKNLIENYGVRPDKDLHAQVKRRWATLNIAPYAGFINPVLKPVFDKQKNIIDVLITYPENFTEQMLEYGREHSFLPNSPKN
jgi:dipeptidyl-peptidase-3